SSSARRGNDVSCDGEPCGDSSADGCGSNVNATARRPRVSASSRARAISARWPTCTPSKLPIATAAPVHASACGRPRISCTRERLPPRRQEKKRCGGADDGLPGLVADERGEARDRDATRERGGDRQ